MDNKKEIILIGLVFLMFFLCVYDVKSMEIPKTSDTDYSDKLLHESYNPITSVSNWYDGIETFWYDTHLANPIFWDLYEPAGLDIHVYNTINSHSNVLRMVDSHSSNYGLAHYYFDLDEYYNAYFCNISFYYFVGSYSYSTHIKFKDDSGIVMGIYSLGSNLGLSWDDGSGFEIHYILSSFSISTWYYITLELHPYFSGVPPTMSLAWYNISIYLNQEHKWTETILPIDINEFGSIEIITSTSGAGAYSVCFDALSIFDCWGQNEFYTQIQNIETFHNVLENRIVLDSSKLFSLFDSIIDKYPNSDNNYRMFFLTDIINNVNILNKNRLLRLIGIDNTQNKYKALQFYFTDLDNPNSFRDNLNQSLKIQINTYDSSNLLINMLNFEMEFNNKTGLISWDAKYRESASLPIWHEYLTNPLFDFSDYLEENDNLTSIQLNCHFFLTYNLTNKLLYIRTEVIFNDNINKVYIYDKLIDLGYGAFYYTQSKIKVMYIDVINPNLAKDYVGNNWYTYNNLRGIRTLESNSTDYFFNFLNVGYFTTDLSYYVAPEPVPEPEPDEETTPREPDYPYWSCDSFKLVNSENRSIFFKNGYFWINDTEYYNTSVNFNCLNGVKYQQKYFYNPKTWSRKDDYSFKFKILTFIIKIEVFNWIVDIFLTIGNSLVLAIQFAWYFIFGILFSWIFLWLLFCIIIPFLNNIIWYYVLFGILFVIHWIIIGVLSLIGLSIPLGIFILTFFLEVVLPILIVVLIGILALIISFIIWLLSGGTANYITIFGQVFYFLFQLFDLLVISILYFVANIEFFLIWILLYIIFIGLGYFKLWYRKIKGFTNSAGKLELSLKGMVYPFYLVYQLGLKMKELVSPNS